MTTRHSLSSFLGRARTALSTPKAQRPSRLIFVVGNESADLDSLCSAVVLAYIRTHTAPYNLHIPLSNLPRADLALRPELTAVLEGAGLQPSDLLTLSELPEDLSAGEEASWYLVDHNALTGTLKKYQDSVGACIDHHVDEGVVRQDAEPRIIETCGSCISLIVEETRSVWKSLREETPEQSLEIAKLARIALAPILIDTINLTETAKVRPKDVQAAEFLTSIITADDPSFSQQRYHEHIAAVKQDISRLNLRDVLRKDYKEWQEDNGLRLGVSSVVQDLAYLLREKAQDDTQVFLQALREWQEERSLDVLAVMTATNPPRGEFHRELLVWGKGEEGLAAVGRFREQSTERLKLVVYRDGELDEGKDRFAWEQRDLAASRKQVAPMLREALIKN